MPSYSDLKAIRLSDLPEEAWVILSGGQSPDAAELGELSQAVAWLFRCVDIRANKVAACKFKVTKGSADIYESSQEDPPPKGWEWLGQLPILLAQAEASVCLTGAAYLSRVGIGRVKSLAWLKASTVRPVWSGDGQLAYFERTLPNEVTPRQLKPEELVYLWLPDHTVETGPANRTPGRAALAAAGVLANMDKFLDAYFDRGAVKVTLLTVDGQLRPGDAKELKTWWQKVAAGVQNAFGAHVVNAQKVNPVIIGEGVKDLENSTLTAEKREDICTAMGVPQSKVTANAANYATKRGDDESFVTDTVEPELRWMEAALNGQLFEPLGCRITFLPDEFSEMQADENERAAAFAQYVGAGIPLLLAAEMLGIYIPDDYRAQLEEEERLKLEQRRKLVEMAPTGNPADAPGQQDEEEQAPPGKPNQPPSGKALLTAQRLEEAGRFERWLKKDPTRDPADFQTDLLDEGEKALIVRQVRGEQPDINWKPDRWVNLPELESPTPEELADEEELARLIGRVERWARREGVDLDQALDAEEL